MHINDINKNEQKEMKNKVKEREKRIKQMNERHTQDFDLDTETVINMTNRNNIKQQNRKMQVNQKQKRKIQKKKKRIKRIIKWTSILLLVIGSIIFAMVSPIFNIKEIDVSNNNIIPKDTIISLSGLKTEQNIFRFLKSNVEKSIKENPYIESVKIHRNIPNKVAIEVEERTRSYSLQFLNSYAYINNQGYILEISENNPNMTIIKGFTTKEENIVPGNRLEKEDLEKLETIIKLTTLSKENGLDGKITSIDISDKNEYIVYIEEEKKTIYLGNNNNLNTKMLYVKKIIEEESGKEGTIYVNGDFSNKFKAYFREKV